MKYKPDKKVKIKGMRKVKHLSKAQVDVLVLLFKNNILTPKLDGGFWMEDEKHKLYHIQRQTVMALKNNKMIYAERGVMFQRTKAADEYLLKYHRNRIKDFIS